MVACKRRLEETCNNICDQRIDNAMNSANDTSSIQAERPIAEHWRFLDGMRGLAAVMVVMFHIREESRKALSPLWTYLSEGMHFGHEAVCIFIVLSGFCLMLPVSKSLQHPDPQKRGFLKGNIATFIGRRARRILPGFYAAVVLSLTLNLFSKEFISAVLHRQWHAIDIPALIPGLQWDVLLPYIFVINNYFNVSNFVMPNYPLWSVGLEWQIYFVFALLLLPLWRKSGILWTLAFTIAFGAVSFFLLPHRLFLWLLALFAMGMFASDLAYDQRWAKHKWNTSRFFGLCSIVLLPLAVGCKYLWELRRIFMGAFLADLLFGLLTLSFILFIVGRARQQEISVWDRLLSSRPLYFLGSISYSIYLTHKMTLLKLYGFSSALYSHLTPDMVFLYNIVVGVPAVLVVAYPFYLCFERPFLVRRSQPK
jgi:peptidoglycan/LPS O-acetylase OafA/YrhL